MSKKAESSLPFDFTKSEVEWPDQEQFPLNISSNRYTEKIVIQDVNNSKSYLIVTGFTSLSHLIVFFGEKVKTQNLDKVRIVLGWSPEERIKKDLGIRVEIENEIKEYWIRQGFSILEHGGAIINLIELIKNDKIVFKVSNAKSIHLHAKIYAGETHAILGSANFSSNGLRKQHEANIRVANNPENNFEQNQYKNILKIAENFFDYGIDYKNKIIDLLEKTLQISGWEEALARAISEMLNRNWKNDFPELKEKIDNAKLWPVQELVVGLAFSILQEQNCVLIATPTGSGKTKLISILQLLLMKWLSDVVGFHKTYSQTICPPLVIDKWEKEKATIFSENQPISIHGLSYDKSDNFEKRMKKILSAKILVIDEAHNFLNYKSKRFQNFSKHSAENIILATATPISKKTGDLLLLVDLLGIDNLDDEQLKEYTALLPKSNNLKEKDLGQLKGFISNFIVRRTKVEINHLIDQNPDKYKNIFGEECRYPEKIYLTYLTGENEKDQELAKQIYQLSKSLKGLIYLREIKKPEEGLIVTAEQYVAARINMARFLSIYNIQSTLRSSRAALCERIQGTDFTTQKFGFKTSKNLSGNIIDSINKIILSNTLPKIDFPTEYFEDWLLDLEKYKAICYEEIKIYEKITELSYQISDKREQSKADFLISLFKKHKLVLSFDNTIITLDYIKSLIEKKNENIDVYVATGNTDKSPIIKKFHLGSEAKNILALCSDTMAEGIDLQESDVVVMLDIPSVLRSAEQRIGRVDRLDSPHKKVNIYFPEDSEPFSLKTDLKLYKALEESRYLIGNNMELPDTLVQRFEEKMKVIKPNEVFDLLREREQDDENWKDFGDAFKNIHDLYSGDNSLIKEEVYNQYKEIKEEVKVKLSVAKCDSEWAFIALKGTKFNPPKWFFIDSNQKAIANLGLICQKLRDKLQKQNNWEEKWNTTIQTQLKNYSRILHKNEKQLLPRKRRKVLEVAESIITQLYKKEKDKVREGLLREVNDLFQVNIGDEQTINFYLFSQQWFDILNEELYELRLNKKRRRQVISLNTLKKEYQKVEEKLTNEKLIFIKENAPWSESLWQNIAACIIGICDKKEETNNKV